MSQPVLTRIAGTRFSRVERVWEGGTAALIGGGASLTVAQVERIGAARARGALAGVVAINDAYLLAPWADVCYFADSHWWRWHFDGIAKPKLELTAEAVKARFAAFPGLKATIQNSGGNVKDDAVHMLRNKSGVGTREWTLSTDPGALATGHSSGHQSANLVTLAGVTRIVLVGFDAQLAANGSSHWHGNHPRAENIATGHRNFNKAWSEMEPQLEALGVEVINCSPGTAVRAFAKRSLEEVLP